MKTGLILSGGGARGFAHLGVLQALDELGVKIDAIAGASAGAVAGAFYLAGHKPQEIHDHIKSYKVYQWARFRLKTPGLLHMDKIAKLFEKYLPDSFEKLPKPLIVATTDLVNCKSVFFNSGKLIPALCASASIPVMFEPVIISGTQYIDGGVLDNFPVEALRERCDTIIGIHVNPVVPGIRETGIRNVMDRSLHLALNQRMVHKIKDCDIFIEPVSCSKYGLLDLKKAKQIMEVGYAAAMERKTELLALK